MLRGFVIGVVAAPVMLVLFGLLGSHFWLVLGIAGGVALLCCAGVVAALLSGARRRDPGGSTAPAANGGFPARPWMPVMPLAALPQARDAWRRAQAGQRNPAKAPPSA
ncbi:MAG: hypothetical protein ACRCUI_03255 [Polymorphobacter sp.]